jgi:hypothetical protein
MSAEAGGFHFKGADRALNKASLGGLDLVLGQLDRVLEALQRHDPERSAIDRPNA